MPVRIMCEKVMCSYPPSVGACEFSKLWLKVQLAPGDKLYTAFRQILHKFRHITNKKGCEIAAGKLRWYKVISAMRTL